MKENMRRANPIEYLVHRTDSPFMASINGHPLPSKFKLPSLDSYDGTRDPFDHIATFKTTMHLQEVPNEIMCRAFPTTLKSPAWVWFSKIPPNSVSSFEELSKLFVNNFIRGQRHKCSSSSLLTIEQGENESMQSFNTCFKREALNMDKVDDKLLLAAFHNGVNSDLFIHKLYEKEPQSMAELVHSAQNFMNAKDVIIAKKRRRSERIKGNPSRHSEQGPRPKKRRTKKGKIEIIRSLALQRGINSIPHWICHLSRFLCKSRMTHPWSGRRKWREIPTSAIGTSIVAFIEIMGMIQTSVLI